MNNDLEFKFEQAPSYLSVPFYEEGISEEMIALADSSSNFGAWYSELEEFIKSNIHGGYFIPWNEKMQILFLEGYSTPTRLDLLAYVVKSLVEVSLFNVEIFIKYKVLTSEKLQKDFIKYKAENGNMMLEDIKNLIIPSIKLI